MNIKLIWLILPSTELVKIAEEILIEKPEYRDLFNIYQADSTSAIPIGKYALSKGAKVIVSRGGTAALLQETLPQIPIVEIKPNIPLILLRYFSLEKKFGKGNVILMASNSFIPTDNQLYELKRYGYEVCVLKELYSEIETKTLPEGIKLIDTSRQLDKILNEKSNICVLGDASACFLADKKKIEYEQIPSSKESILDAMEDAIKLIRMAFIGLPFNNPEVEIAFERAIKPTFQYYGFDSLTQIERYIPGSITNDILNQIQKARIALVDITDERPNCYYELGFIRGLGKLAIITAKEGTKLHFDISSDRVLIWSSWQDLKTKLELSLEELGYRKIIKI